MPCENIGPGFPLCGEGQLNILRCAHPHMSPIRKTCPAKALLHLDFHHGASNVQISHAGTILT